MCTWIKGWNVLILTKGLLYIKESRDPHHSWPEQVQDCAALHYMSSMAFRPVLCCTGPLAQDKLRQHIVTKEPAGSSHSLLAIVLPVWSCPYLKCCMKFSCKHPL